MLCTAETNSIIGLAITLIIPGGNRDAMATGASLHPAMFLEEEMERTWHESRTRKEGYAR